MADTVDIAQRTLAFVVGNDGVEPMQDVVSVLGLDGLMICSSFGNIGPVSSRNWSAEGLEGERQFFATRLRTRAQDYARFTLGGYTYDFADEGKAPGEFTPVAAK